MMNMDSISLFHYNDYESSDDDDDEITLFHMYNLCSYDCYYKKKYTESIVTSMRMSVLIVTLFYIPSECRTCHI